ncbi:MAG TPA: cytidyltransferase, partial [Galbitalea sp.]
ELEAAFGQIGVEVVYFPYTVTTSSTRLRQALEKLA